MRKAGWGLLILLMLAGCRPDRTTEGLYVVTTTTIVADLVRMVGAPYVEVESLMGPGIDPHLYRASEGDVARMRRADIVFYNGLHLEGKMAEVLERMQDFGTPTRAVASCIPDSLLLPAPGFGGVYDPHIWMDVHRWTYAIDCVEAMLVRQDTLHAEAYRAAAARARRRLDRLDTFVRRRIAELPPERRILVTSHDAFRYFGDAYGVEVHGLLGISTASEAGTADVQALARFIAERRIPAIFVETSVPERYVRALQQAVRARGWEVRVAGPLYSDALGDPDTPEGTYEGMIRYNVNTIVEALKHETGTVGH